MALKVYGTSYGTKRRIVAAPSKAAAARALGISIYTARAYMSETGNADEIMLATGAPGRVFSATARRPRHLAPFVEEVS